MTTLKYRIFKFNPKFNTMPIDEVRPGFTQTGLYSKQALTTMNWFEPAYKTSDQYMHLFDRISYALAKVLRFFLGSDVRDIHAPVVVYIPRGLSHGAESVGNERVLKIDVFGAVREDHLRLCVNGADFSQ